MATSQQPSSQISLSSVLFRLEQLLPLLACGPYSTCTLSELATFCMEVKAVGPLLDVDHKDKMDIMQTLLTKICQDTQLNLELRLQVLEVIELRTLDWTSNEAVDNYYQERFSQFEERRKEQERKSASRAARSREGEKKRKLSQTSPSMTSNQEQHLDNKQSLMVNGERIFLNSSNPELTANARKVMVDHLSTQSSLPDSSTPAYMKEAPLNWDKLVPHLPSVILQKVPVTGSAAASGDSNPSLTVSKKNNVSSMPGSLPLMRQHGQ